MIDVSLEMQFKQEDLDKINSKLKKISPNDKNKVLLSSFKTVALMVEGKLKDNISGNYLKVRSGHLRSSIGSLVSEGEGTLRINVGSGIRQGERVKYANILETGGTIVPTKGRFLTIPLNAAKTNAGVGRFTAAEVRAGATQYTSSFINKGIIFGIIGKKGKPIPLFILKTSVSIPAKYWMSKTVVDSTQETVDTILKTIDEVLNS